MRWKKVRSLTKKEFLNTRRDKRGFWTALLLPGLFFPLMMIVLPLVSVLASKSGLLKPELKIAYQGTLPEAFKQQLSGNLAKRVIKLEPVTDAQKALTRYVLAIELPERFPKLSVDAPATIKVYADASKRTSELARMVLDQAVSSYNSEIWRADLAAKGIASKPTVLLSTKSVEEGKAASPIFSMLGILLPLMFVLWGMTGSQSSAMEALAYERDHGTFETLLTSNVTRLEVLLGKYLNVLLMALMAASSGVIGLLLLIWLGQLGVQYFLGSFAPLVTGLIAKVLPQSFDIVGVIYGLLAALSTLSVIAAIALFPNIFAPSIKEAQLYIAPAMLSVMALTAPALISEFAGLGKLTQFIPISNTVSILSASFSAEPDWLRLLIALLVNGALVLAMLGLQLWLLAREKTIFKSA